MHTHVSVLAFGGIRDILATVEHQRLLPAFFVEISGAWATAILKRHAWVVAVVTEIEHAQTNTMC